MKQLTSDKRTDVVREDSVFHGYSGMCMTPSGHLVLGRRLASGHGAVRWAKVMACRSDDRGRGWSQPIQLADGAFDQNNLIVGGGGIYLTALRNGSVLLHYDASAWPDRIPEVAYLHRSEDGGRTWSPPKRIGDQERTIGDGAILELSNGTLLLCTGPWLKMLRSTDGGQSWSSPTPIVSGDTPLRLAEVCLSELSEERVLILMRESTYANFPLFGALSEDNGQSWSKPFPTPFIGHWPSSVRLADGRHIVAYRNVGGRCSSVVWCGDLSKVNGYEVSSCRYNNLSEANYLCDEGLVIDNEGDKGQFTQFFLFPPDSASAEVCLEAELRCLSNAGQACAIGVRGAGWLRIFPDHIDIEHFGGDGAVSLDGTAWHCYRFQRRNKRLSVEVDGREVISAPSIELPPVNHAPCNAFGNKFDYRTLPRPEHYPMRVRLPKYVRPSNSGKSIWRSVRLDITGNQYLPDYHYQWLASRDGLPDHWGEENLLELDTCRDAGDWGKPVVACWPDGECFAVDYFGNGAPVGFGALSFLQPDRGHNCYVAGYRFQVSDIPHSAHL